MPVLRHLVSGNGVGGGG